MKSNDEMSLENFLQELGDLLNSYGATIHADCGQPGIEPLHILGPGWRTDFEAGFIDAQGAREESAAIIKRL